MKAVCVRPDRTLEVREIAAPTVPAPGHLLVDIEACAINHGDKTFLRLPPISPFPRKADDVWGASGVGRVVAIGEGVPEVYAGKNVAIYRSLRPTADTIGLWCERALIHHQCCLILPDDVRARDYCGSLVNVITAYAFLRQAAEDGHHGIVVTAGHSATGTALAALARDRDVPVIRLVRSASARDALRSQHIDHVLLTTEEDFESAFGALARRLRATAVFEGLGGDIVGRLAADLPENATFYFYGFLAGGTPISLPTSLFMTKNLSMKRFSNFQSTTVRDGLNAALTHLRGCIDDPLFRTRIGQEFRFDEIDSAMSYEAEPGAKAVLVA